MTKSELVEFVFESGVTGETRAAAERAVDAVFSGIARGLKRDKKVQIVGFGAFEVKKKKARTGRNPRTGETIKIEARRTVAFRPGGPLRSALAGLPLDSRARSPAS